jgi:hypothetical protein
MGHEVGINLQSVEGEDSDHIEFRHWDGTLNPSAIQAQVKMSAAMTVAAKRIADTHGTVPRPRESVGAHVLRQSVRDVPTAPLSEAEQVTDTASARAFIDTLFTRPQDKTQMAGLFALTHWQSRRPGQGEASPAA